MLFDGKHLLTAFCVIRQGPINKAMRGFRITTAENPAEIHPPKPNNPHHHGDHLPWHLLRKLLPSNLSPGRKHLPAVQGGTGGSINLRSLSKQAAMLIKNKT